jgi:hypothetical protein
VLPQGIAIRPADEALVRRHRPAARRLRTREGGRRTSPRRRVGTAHELPRLWRARAALQLLRASFRIGIPRPRVVPGMPDDGRAVALSHRGSRLARSRFVTNSEPVGQANGSPSLPPCEALASRLPFGGRATLGRRPEPPGADPQRRPRVSSRAAVWSGAAEAPASVEERQSWPALPTYRLRAGVLLSAGGDARSSRLAVVGNGTRELRVLSRRVRGQSGYALPIGDGVAP